MRELTERRKRFVAEYLLCLNATIAAMNAGYSSKSARYAGRDLLKDPRISELIHTELEKIKQSKIATVQEILEYLTAVMRGETEAEIIVIEKTGNGCSHARRIMKPPAESERLRAAELLGKRYGLFNCTVEVSSAIPVVIVDDMAELDDGHSIGVRIDSKYIPNTESKEVQP